MKKRLAAALIGILICFSGIGVYAEDAADMTALPVAAQVNGELPAKSAILIEQQTGRVLFEKEADTPMPPASITKVMTLLLTMEVLDAGRFSLSDMVSCSETAASMGGSQIWLEPGEQISVDDLIKATSISSANDSAVALAELVAGSEEAFVVMMNERSAQLGMTATTFKNATGLDAEGHLSTARDIAVMSRELLKYDLIKTYSGVWMCDLRGGATQLVNTNKLVRFYDGCNGLKTGTTDSAGSCLSASATRKGMSIVAVTLGSRTSADRFSAARGLLDYGFANYSRIELPEPEGISDVKITRGLERSVGVVSKTPGAVVVKAADKENIKQTVTLLPEAQAPIESGQKLGSVTVKVGDAVICEYDLVAANEVERMTFGNAVKTVLESLLRL